MNVNALESRCFAGRPHDFLPASESEKRPFSASFIAALLLHAILLLFSGMVFVRGPEYGIDLGSGGLEVYLVAAPVDISNNPELLGRSIRERDAELEANLAAKMLLPASEKNKEAEKREASQNKSSVLAAKDSEHRGDGSAPVAGQDPATFYSSGGAWIESQASHFKNPPPEYPRTAIELEQEGLVLVSARISREGRPSRVELKQSSGFPLLDQSALKALKKWKFSPARTGFLTHEAWIEIPIRFKLEDVQ